MKLKLEKCNMCSALRCVWPQGMVHQPPVIEENRFMIDFYYNAAPNPMKVALLLEELGLAYTAHPVDTRKGDQFSTAFQSINPNSKVPAIVDHGVVVFDSNAILLFLSEKYGQFAPNVNDAVQRAAMYSWLMFIATGVGPFSGQAVHFRHAAPPKNDYALNRYDFEAHRHWAIVEKHLEQHRYFLGLDYSIVDMAFWGWARMVPFVLGKDSAWLEFPQIKRLLDEINARDAAKRAETLKSQHAFKAELDEEAKNFLFPQNLRLKGLNP